MFHIVSPSHGKPVIVRIKGGLGNQLFCYAAARRLALVNEAELVIDDVTGFARDRTYGRSYALDRFQISARKATPHERMEPLERYRRGLAKLIARRRAFHLRNYIEQESRDFDSRLLEFEVKGTVYLDGLWQSESYFKDVADVIREDLTIIPPEDTANLEMSKQIEACNAVAIHLRWFDRPDTSSAKHNLKKSYYTQAIKKIQTIVAEPHFFIFSDNPELAKQVLELPDDMITSVNHNRGEKNAFADLWLMTNCKHFIIANSTFSWWGAWLGKSANKTIVAPAARITGITSWNFKGQLPNEWIQI